MDEDFSMFEDDVELEVLREEIEDLKALLRKALFNIKLPPVKTSGNEEENVPILISDIEEVLGE